MIAIIVEVLKNIPTLAEATVVSLANQLKITMFGREVSNTISTEPGRKIYNLHPYRKAGSGAVCMPAYQDEKGESHVLLGQKKPKPNQTNNPLILLGGYFQPHPLAGHVPDLEKLSADEKDKIEEAIRNGFQNAYREMSPSPESRNNVVNAIFYDANVTACAVRELKEEASLTGVQPQFLMEQSHFPDTNPDLHSINLSYLFDYGTCSSAPEAKEKLAALYLQCMSEKPRMSFSSYRIQKCLIAEKSLVNTLGVFANSGITAVATNEVQHSTLGVSPSNS